MREATRIAGNLLDANIALDDALGSSSAARLVNALLWQVRAIEEIDAVASSLILRGLSSSDPTRKRELLIDGVSRLVVKDRPSVMWEPESFTRLPIDLDAVIEE